jgi:bacillithiol synthase
LNISETDPARLPFSKLFTDYLAGKPTVEPFYEFSPFKPADARKCAGGIPEPADRTRLVEELSDFNSDFGLDSAATENIARLASPGSLTLVTGQQLSLYGGPLFTVLKTLSVIHMASHYEKELGRPVIPVFWLADEDHDYEEAATVVVPGNEGLESKLLAAESATGGSVGRIRLGPDLLRVRDEIRLTLRETDFSSNLWNLLDACYKPEHSFRQATGMYLSRLFSHHGLIFAGSDHDGLKKLMAAPIKKAILDADDLQKSLENGSESIASVYHRQAAVHDNTLFMHTESGTRERLVRTRGAWTTESGTVYDTGTLADLASDTPESFSPNVFLRPVLQDHLLPNLGYVGGPAEVAYFGQMKSFYREFGRRMPLILPRLSATIIEPAIARIMSEIPFEADRYQERIENLEKEWLRISDEPDTEALFGDWYKAVAELGSQYEERVGDIDPTLTDMASRAASDYTKALEKLKQKLTKTIKMKQETQLNRIGRIKNELFPGGGLQERQYAHIYFANKYGSGIWDKLLGKLTPHSYREHQLVHL